MKTHATIATALALLAPCAAQDSETSQVVVPTTLSVIRSAPDSFRGVEVSFPVQFASIGNMHNPFFTRFVASDFANFMAWADEQPIWRKDQFDGVFGNLFMSKENPKIDQLFNVAPYQRLQLTGIVRNAFRDQPWIEVTEIVPLQGQVTTATLAHMYRGEQHMSQRQWNRAISELSLAPADNAPDAVRAAVHKLVGVCYLRIGEPVEALNHLGAAADLAPQDGELAALVRTATQNPDVALDRAVDIREVADHERPLWEAFEGTAATPPAPQG